MNNGRSAYAITRAGVEEHPFRLQWNHNTHYFPSIAASIPESARQVCDVGCGDGTLTRYLARPGRVVTGIDVDEDVLPEDVDLSDLSDPPAPAGLLRFLIGSADDLPLADESQDAVTMSMVLHHLDHAREGGSRAALRECARVLRPGGVLTVLGYAKSVRLPDFAHELRDALVHRRVSRRTVSYDPPVRLSEPVLTWAATTALFAEVLPGSQVHRVPLWRYLATWVRP